MERICEIYAGIHFSIFGVLYDKIPMISFVDRRSRQQL
jgi:hypothetical protein